MHKALALIRLRRQGPRTRGQSLVEFALILPVFLLFFGAVLDLGRVAAAQISVANVAREAAFQAAQTPTSYSAGQPCPAGGTSNLVICRAMLEAKNTPLQVAPVDVSMACSPDCTEGLGHTVTVSVVGHFNLLTPILSAFFNVSQDLAFTASSTHQLKTLPATATATPAPTPTPTPTPTGAATPTPTPTPTSVACQEPSAGFTFKTSPPNGKAPLTLDVTDTSTSLSCGITSWFWVFGDGATSVQKDPPDHVYLVQGSYDVTLTVTNAAGSNTTGAVRITVKKP
jgi:Flp pilus assembly protein TadG